eukprot:15399908-Alexandrium_andersonii.AAC.1
MAEAPDFPTLHCCAKDPKCLPCLPPLSLFLPPPTAEAATDEGRRRSKAWCYQSRTRWCGAASIPDVGLPPVASGSDLERSRSRLGVGVVRARGAAPSSGAQPHLRHAAEGTPYQ